MTLELVVATVQGASLDVKASVDALYDRMESGEISDSIAQELNENFTFIESLLLQVSVAHIVIYKPLKLVREGQRLLYQMRMQEAFSQMYKLLEFIANGLNDYIMKNGNQYRR